MEKQELKVNVDLKRVFNFVDVDSLRPGRFDIKSYLQNFFESSLGLYAATRKNEFEEVLESYEVSQNENDEDVKEKISIIIRERDEGKKLRLVGCTSSFENVEDEIDAGDLHDFYVENQESGCIDEFIDSGVLFFPQTGFRIDYSNEEQDKLGFVFKSKDAEKLARTKKNKESIDGKIDRSVCFGSAEELQEAFSEQGIETISIESLYGYADKGVKEIKVHPNGKMDVVEETFKVVTPNGMIENNAIGWSFPLVLDDEKEIWGFANFFSEDWSFFAKPSVKDFIKAINGHLLKVAKFSTMLNLVYESYENISLARKAEESNEYRFTEKVYQKLEKYDIASRKYLQFLDGVEAFATSDVRKNEKHSNHDYIDALFSALYCSASTGTGFHLVNMHNFKKRFFGRNVIQADSHYAGILKNTDDYFECFQKFLRKNRLCAETFSTTVFYMEKATQDLEKLGCYEAADGIYYRLQSFRQMRFLNKWSPRYFIHFFWWLVSGYGTSFSRMIFFVILIWSTFGVLYATVGIDTNWSVSKAVCNIERLDLLASGNGAELKPGLESIPYSVPDCDFLVKGLSYSALVMLTLGTGDLTDGDKNVACLIILLFHLVLSYALLGTLLTVILRKVMPRF